MSGQLAIVTFIAGDATGLSVLGVSDPSAPTEIGELATPGPAHAVTVGDDGHVYVGSGTNVRVVDVSD